MNLEIEKREENLVVETDEKKTIMALLKSYLWDHGAEAGFEEGHPYVGNPRMVCNSDNPAEDLEDAVESAKQDLDAFKAEIK